MSAGATKSGEAGCGIEVHTCEQCRRHAEEMATAAVELVQLRAEVLTLRHENRRLKAQGAALSGSVCDAAAELGRVRLEMVREMTKGTCGHE